MRFDPLAERSYLLDCIRATAITLVLVFHVATRYDYNTLDNVAVLFHDYGFLGVDMFFPLSGFLITRFLLRDAKAGVVGPAFFLRRIFRIMPIYYVALAIYVAASLVTGIDRHTLQNLWAPLTFMTGWFIFFEGREAVPFEITWSLSVEEFAYVLFGIVAWVLRKYFRIFVVICCIVPLLIRIALNAQGYDNIYFLPIARLDAIAFGGLTAILLKDRRPALLIVASLFAVVIAMTYLGDAASRGLFLTQVALVVCGAIVVFETWLKSWSPQWLRPFALYGFYSYFIYLFHFFNIYFIFEASRLLGIDNPPFWIMTVLTMGITYVQAVLSYRYFEGPIMAFGRRLEPKPAASPAGGRA